MTASPGFAVEKAESRRWAPWRSPEDQPVWARPGLLLITAAAVFLYTWGITRVQDSGYLLAAVRSMTVSWKAFVFGVFDPSGSATIDKVPGFLWPQALSARVFGFHPWALALPQAIEGAVSVLGLYRVVRRWAGPGAGLIAAAVFTLTPTTAAAFGHSLTEDPSLTMCLILAAGAWQKAVETAGLRPLVLAAVWIGIGFQMKMFLAWTVLPAFGVVYLVAAPAPMRDRWRRAAVAGAVCVALSASWATLVSIVPAADRPYVDGSTDNNAFPMIVGYNGIGRVSGVQIAGAMRPLGGTGVGKIFAPPPGAVAHGISPGLGRLMKAYGSQASDGGWAKLFHAYLGSQIGWLYPLALAALVLGLLRRRGMPRTDPLRAGYLMWGMWIATVGVVFSAGQVGHAAYTTALAAPLAALAGAGMVELIREWRSSTTAKWLLPAVVVIEAAWTAVLAGQYRSFIPWLRPVVVVLAVLAAVMLTVRRLTARGNRAEVGAVAVAVAVVSMLATPAAWTVSTLDTKYAGSAVEPAAGAVGAQVADPEAGLTTKLNPQQSQILAYVQVHRAGAKYLLATDSSTSAEPYIAATGQPVLAFGGWSGLAPVPSFSHFRQLVATGRLRYVLFSGGLDISSVLGYTPLAWQNAVSTELKAWVRQHCARAPVVISPDPVAAQRHLPPATLYACGPSSGS